LGGQLINSALSGVNVPGGAVSCPAGAPEIEKAEWESANDFAVRQNSQTLWSGLVCRPWIAGEFGTGPVANVAARRHGLDLLEAQGVSRLEQQQIINGAIDAADLYAENKDALLRIAHDTDTI